MSFLLTSLLVLASLTPSMARLLYVMSSCASFPTFLSLVHRAPPRKQPRILLRSLQFSLRTFPRSKGVLSIWPANPTVYVPVHYTYFDPHGRSGLQGRYIPLFASAVYDQNTALVENGLTPINLTSVIIGAFSEAYAVSFRLQLLSGNGITDPFTMIDAYYYMTCTPSTVPPVLDIRFAFSYVQFHFRFSLILSALAFV